MGGVVAHPSDGVSECVEEEENGEDDEEGGMGFEDQEDDGRQSSPANDGFEHVSAFGPQPSVLVMRTT